VPLLARQFLAGFAAKNRKRVVGFSDETAAPPAPSVASLGDFTLEELERAMVQRVLEANGGNISRAASALGLSRAALYRRLEKFGLGRALVVADRQRMLSLPTTRWTYAAKNA
jgi:DNA-binding NtrC family response regulator